MGNDRIALSVSDQIEAVAVDVRGLAQMLSATSGADDMPEWGQEAISFSERALLGMAERLNAAASALLKAGA